MSRQARPTADRAAQNAQTLKALVKLEGNKVCADCKRNKHPRWASWNLGVFVCIRCSGIHRGMGTHISRVKSVDLDAWTDEQLQSILKWGNKRANKYWEAKLAPGHVPSEAKIENFIRTKYDTKRWVMDGPMPDPSTLDEGDDDVPLNIVQEKAKIERSASLRTQGASQAATTRPVQPPQNVNLFDDFNPEPPVRPNTADIPQNKPTRTGPPPAAAKPSKPQDSLLGLDFFGGPQQAGMGRPSSAASNPVSTTNSRGDLKQSILSLYSSAPKPQPAPQATHGRQPSFGGMTSPPVQQADAFGGLSDAFGGLTFSNNSNNTKPPAPQPTSSAFSGLGSFPSSMPPKATPSAPQVTSPPLLSGGNFFDSLGSSSAHSQMTAPAQRQNSSSLDFGFTQKPAVSAAAPIQPAPASTSTDLFANDDFGGFATTAPAPAVPQQSAMSSLPMSSSNQFGSDFNFPTSSSNAPFSGMTSPPATSKNDFNSAFNLSTPTMSAPPPVPASRSQPFSQPSANMVDPWGTGAENNAWNTPDPAPVKPAAPKVELGSVPSKLTPNDISGGWGSPISSANKSTVQPTVTADEDFGGWTSAASPGAAPVGSAAKSGGFANTSDPFDNPWG